MSNLFKQRLNKVLNDAEVPEELAERIEAFAKIFGVKRHQAAAILNGKTPEDDLLGKIAQEFEVKIDWLRGKEISNKENAHKEPK